MRTIVFESPKGAAHNNIEGFYMCPSLELVAGRLVPVDPGSNSTKKAHWDPKTPHALLTRTDIGYIS
jgi:hypothetical protein